MSTRAADRADPVLHEFASRRVRQLVADVASLALVLAALALLLSSNRGGQAFILLAIGFWAAAMAGNRLVTHYNWRCPQCGVALWGDEMRIDPLFTHEHIHCLFCNAELLPVR